MRIKTYLLELQYRFFLITIHFTLLLFLSYVYKKEILYILNYNQEELFPYFISTHLTEIFSVYIKLSLFLGFYFTIPFFVFQIKIFLDPALYKYESLIINNYINLVIFLFFLCSIFTYNIFIPYCWKFFSSFQSSLIASHVQIHFEAKLNAYCNFFLESLVSIQIFFQLMGSIFFLIPKIKPEFYSSSRKLVYFFLLLIATLITPPDILSQIFLTSFFVVIYENFIFFFLLKKEYKRANNGI